MTASLLLTASGMVYLNYFQIQAVNNNNVIIKVKRRK